MIRSVKIIKTDALDISLIFFISASKFLEILSDNFSIAVFSNSKANNKKYDEFDGYIILERK